MTSINSILKKNMKKPHHIFICIILCILLIYVIYIIIKYILNKNKNNEKYTNKNSDEKYICRLIGYTNHDDGNNILNSIDDIELYKAINICKNNKNYESFSFKVNNLGDKKGNAKFFSNIIPIFIENGTWNEKNFVSLYYKKDTKCSMINNIGTDILNMKYLTTKEPKNIKKTTSTEKVQQKIQNTDFGSVSNNTSTITNITPTTTDVLDIKKNGVFTSIPDKNLNNTVPDNLPISDISSTVNKDNIGNIVGNTNIRTIRKIKMRRYF